MSQRIENNSQPGSEDANKVDLSVKKSHNTEATHTPESKARAHAEKAEKLEKAKKTIEHQKQKEQKEKHQPVSKKDLEKTLQATRPHKKKLCIRKKLKAFKVICLEAQESFQKLFITL